MEKPNIIRHGVGTLCITLGVVPVILGFSSWSETGPFGWFFYVALILLFGWLGIGMLRDFSRRNLNRCVAMITLFGALFLISGLLSQFSVDGEFYEVNSGFTLFFTVLIAIFMHVVVMKFLSKWSGMESPRVKDLISRGVLILLALQVWLLLSDLAEQFWTKESQIPATTDNIPLFLLETILPLFLAIGFYQWAKRLVGYEKEPSKPYKMKIEIPDSKSADS